MERHGIFPASFDSLDVAQIGSASIQNGNSKSMVTPGGALDTAAVIQAFADPRCALDTQNLGVLSTVSPTVGLAVSTAFAFRYQKRVDGGTFATSTAHTKVGGTKGFLYPSRLRVKQDDPEGAQLELAFVPLYDGTNAVLVPANSQNFDSGVPVPAFTAIFYQGPFYLAGSQIDGVTGFEVDFGIEYRPVRNDGDVYARSGFIVRRRPQIQVTLNNVAYLATRGFFGSAYTSAGVALYYWKGVHGGDRVAAATGQHVKISSVTGEMSADDLSVRDNGDGTHTYTINPSGATPTLALSTSATIGG